MKKLIVALLILVMAFSIVGCGPTEAEVGGSPTPTPATGTKEPVDEPVDEPEETAEINVIIWGVAGVPTDEALQMVNDKLNEITIEKINTKVNFQIWDTGTYVGQAAVAVSSGDDIDLMCTFPAAAAHFAPMSSQNMLLPLDELLVEYAPELLEIVPASYFGATTKNGEIVAVPVMANKVNDMYWVARKSVFDTLGVNEADVKTLDDIHEVLLKVKEQHPNMLPLSGDNLTLDFTYPAFELTNGGYFDPLGETSAVAAIVRYDKDGNTDYKVVNRYETDEWLNITGMLQQWYREGLIDKDAITHHGQGWPLQRDKNVFSAIRVTNMVSIESQSQAVGEDLVIIKLQEGTLATNALAQMTWALPVTCDEPEAVTKFMNLLYTDAEVINLLNYGVEGVHYILQDDGTVAYPEGVTQENAEFNPGYVDYLGNHFLAYVRSGIDPDIQQRSFDFVQTATTSPLLGFSFDTGPVSDIYAQLSYICHDEYGPMLFTGAAPDGYQDEFIEKLYSVGLQEYLDEAQRQLDEWLASK